jgi:mono/diheme cytochrome c family protein
MMMTDAESRNRLFFVPAITMLAVGMVVCETTFANNRLAPADSEFDAQQTRRSPLEKFSDERSAVALASTTTTWNWAVKSELRGQSSANDAGSATGTPKATQTASAPARSGKVVEVFRTACLECHDNDGRGAISRDTLPRIPDFTDAKWHGSRSDAELSRSILDGKGKSMPKMKDKLGTVQVSQMVAFVRGFQGGKQVVPDEEEAPTPALDQQRQPAGGGQRPAPVESTAARRPSQPNREASRLFQRFCARCHGTDGKGGNVRDSMAAIPDFSSGAWQAKRRDAQLAVSILDGKGTQMPAFRGKVPANQVREVVAVIRALGPESNRVTSASPNDFEARFRDLLKEFEDLRQQQRALTESPAPGAAPAARPSPSPH